MRTFSLKVKKELCSNLSNKYNNILSEIVGIIISRAQFNFNNMSFNISLDNEYVINYIESIFLSNFLKYSFEIIKEQSTLSDNCSLVVMGNNMHKFLSDIGIILENNKKIKFDKTNEIRTLDFKSFIKGVFICCGSVINPEKRYHLEFVIQNLEFGNYLVKLLAYYGFAGKLIKRKYKYVVYMKESDKICEFLNVLGANDGVLDFERVRVNREYSNNKNRIKNCIEANEDKLIIASVNQVRYILFIDNKIGINKLSKKLREIAKLRLENKEISLKDLGMLLDPPLGKSGVLHRLKKIEKIAKELGFLNYFNSPSYEDTIK